MKKIHKLVLKAYIGPLLATFFIVQFVLMLNFVWRYIDELTGKGLDVSTIVELFACATASMIPLGLPLAMLFSAIMTMGNLGESFELLAMKAAGMSLMKIFRPLFVLVLMIAVGSFYISNKLVPYANERMYDIIIDVRQQREEMKFPDDVFFTGLPNMVVKVHHQDETSGKLEDVVIFDFSDDNGDMTTTIADSGYMKMSDDKSYLNVTLYNGVIHEHTRNSMWYTDHTLRSHRFERQDATIPIAKLQLPEQDMTKEFSESQTRDMEGLDELIDSLHIYIRKTTAATYGPLVKERIFPYDHSILGGDSIVVDKTHYKTLNVEDSIKGMPLRERSKLIIDASNAARIAKGSSAVDEQMSKIAITQLYRAQNEWHRKLTLPVSIIIFFFIGAPLGAIIRKGGFGTPIVISLIFFVIYYVISISGSKMSGEGIWEPLYGMWLPTFVLAPVAVYLMYKATNDSSLLDTDWYDGKIRKFRRKVSKYIPNWMKIGKKKKKK
ncbi:MAG: YjgP/YjgQ family permease [Rikenellaceae bacterium]|nr:YjgP/YjgQ family permease [Rikenellaceae bacterium]